MASDRGVYGTEPVYERLSFCNSPDALWAKLVTGGWDWLGVKPDDRTFVLGAPSRSTGFVAMAAATVTKAGAVSGQFGVRVRVPRFPGTSDTWCSSADAARDEYERTLEALGEEGKPALFRVELMIDCRAVKDETLVRTPSTYEGLLTKRNYQRRTR